MRTRVAQDMSGRVDDDTLEQRHAARLVHHDERERVVHDEAADVYRAAGGYEDVAGRGGPDGPVFGDGDGRLLDDVLQLEPRVVRYSAERSLAEGRVEAEAS